MLYKSLIDANNKFKQSKEKQYKLITAHNIQVIGKKFHKCYNLQNSVAHSSIFHMEQVLMYIFTQSILHEALLVQRPLRIDSESDKE